MPNPVLVAAVSRPQNSAGWLIPVFKSRAGVFFQAGDPDGSSFSQTVLDEMIDLGAMTAFEKHAPRGNDFTERALRQPPAQAKRNALPATIFYLSPIALDLIGGSDRFLELLSMNRSNVLSPSGVDSRYVGHLFCLLSRDAAGGLLAPRLLKWAEERFEDELCQRLKTLGAGRCQGTCLSGSPSDMLEEISHLMMNVAMTGEQLERAIAHETLVMLCGPYAENWRVWLGAAVRMWGILPDDDPQYWKDRAYGILDKTEARIPFERVRQRIQNGAVTAQR